MEGKAAGTLIKTATAEPVLFVNVETNRSGSAPTFVSDGKKGKTSGIAARRIWQKHWLMNFCESLRITKTSIASNNTSKLTADYEHDPQLETCYHGGAFFDAIGVEFDATRTPSRHHQRRLCSTRGFRRRPVSSPRSKKICRGCCAHRHPRIAKA